MSSSVASPPPTDPLDAECRALTRYLAGREPDAYVLARYRDGHRAIPYRRANRPEPVDAVLVTFAAHGGWRARVADAYARIFRPHGALRQKLTLLLAILETAPATYRQFTGGGSGMAHAVAATAGALVLFGSSLLAGIVLLGPAHLALGRRGSR